MKYLKAIWIFISYIFVPQWGSKRRKEQEAYERQLEAAEKNTAS